MLTQEDHRRFEKLIGTIRKLRLSDPAGARLLEIELCSQALVEAEAMPAPADLDEESRLEFVKSNVRQVLAGDIDIENIVSIDQEPELPSSNLSRLIH
jgi:hypothetical protein